MTPAQLALILSALFGAALVSVIVVAVGNRKRLHKRRFLPAFAFSALLGMALASFNLKSMMPLGWIVGGILGFALQRERV